MTLKMARLCLDCEEIFEGKTICPRCGSETWYPIMGWIRPMGEAQIEVSRKKKNILILTMPPQKELLTGTAL